MRALTIVKRAARRLSTTKWSPATQAVWADHGVAGHGGDVAPPIGVSTTFDAAEDGHVYGRLSAPTRVRCEAVLSAVEGGDALLFASGNAATTAAVSALAGGAPVTVYVDGGYHGTHQAFAALPHVTTAPLPPPDACGALAPTDVLWLETPRNPDARLRDVAAYAASPARVVVDGTFAPPPAQFALDLGATCVVHAATKFLGGHSDLLAGVVATRDAGVLEAARGYRDAAGAAPGSLEAWLLLRSLRTLDLRVRRQSASALAVAEALEADGTLGLRRVWYPGLASHPDRRVREKQMAMGGGVLAIELHAEAAARALPERLALFRSATSLGGVESLAEWRRQYDDDVSPYLVRLSVGLEDPEDLVADLKGAIAGLVAEFPAD